METFVGIISVVILVVMVFMLGVSFYRHIKEMGWCGDGHEFSRVLAAVDSLMKENDIPFYYTYVQYNLFSGCKYHAMCDKTSFTRTDLTPKITLDFWTSQIRKITSRRN